MAVDEMPGWNYRVCHHGATHDDEHGNEPKARPDPYIEDLMRGLVVV
jgi:hypothetical protein